MHSVRTHYDDLGVRRDATQAEIAQAFDAKVSELEQLQRQGDPTAGTLLGMVRTSFAVLSNADRRAEHDEWIRRNESVGPRPRKISAVPSARAEAPGPIAIGRRLPLRLPRVGMLVACLAVVVAFAAGIYVADSSLAVRQEYGLSLAGTPPAKATLLNVQIGARYPVRVTKVIDGDTVDARWPDKRVSRVRLSDIDAPESCQEFGPEAKRALVGLVLHKDLEIEVRDVDRNSRVVGRIYVGEQDVNAGLVASGAAWFYPEYSNDAALHDVENEARDAKLGLWALPLEQRIEPWLHRQQYSCSRSSRAN